MKEKIEVPENVNTRLLEKNFSPMIVRKYQMKGWPCFVALICDCSLSDLDQVVNDAFESFGEVKDDIQEIRNVCGYVSQYVTDYYNAVKKNSVEGTAVLWYVDKCFVSSLYGDFMVHASCKQELFSIINTLPHI